MNTTFCFSFNCFFSFNFFLFFIKNFFISKSFVSSTKISSSFSSSFFGSSFLVKSNKIFSLFLLLSLSLLFSSFFGSSFFPDGSNLLILVWSLPSDSIFVYPVVRKLFIWSNSSFLFCLISDLSWISFIFSFNCFSAFIIIMAKLCILLRFLYIG